MKTAAENIGARAAAGMHQGLHCSEAILGACNTEFGLGLNETALKTATGFAGGIGCSQDVCGALTGAIMVIGALYGRAEAGVNDQACQEYCRRFREDFIARFGSSSCQTLTKEVWGKPNHGELCADQITSGATEMLYNFLKELEKVEREA